VLWGTHLFLAGSQLVWWGQRASRRLPGGWWLVATASAVVVGVGAVTGLGALGLYLPLLIASVWLACQPGLEGARRLHRLMLVLALGMMAGVEVVYVADFLEGTDWRRMNTVFKFSFQAWVLLGLALGAGLPQLWRRLRQMRPLGGTAWRVVTVVLLGAAVAYVPLAIEARVTERFLEGPGPRWTLDGSAFMQTAVYRWPDSDSAIALRHDLDVIRWLWVHAQGTPVVAEAPLGYYREGGCRIASFTGLPNLLGMHQREQRPWGAVAVREREAEALYTSADERQALGTLEELDVAFVYVGQLERIAYGGEGMLTLARLEEQNVLVTAYQNEGGVLYRVVPDALREALARAEEAGS
jgi:uncharacterized membrane protein